jgi:hypothetical protein
MTKALRVATGTGTGSDGGLLGGLLGNGGTGQGDLLGVVTSATQLTVPGGLGTTSLPYATTLSPWVSPVDGLLQNATVPLGAELFNAVTATGTVPQPAVVPLIGSLASPVDLTPLEASLRSALPASGSFAPLPALPVAPPPTYPMPPFNAPVITVPQLSPTVAPTAPPPQLPGGTVSGLPPSTAPPDSSVSTGTTGGTSTTTI